MIISFAANLTIKANDNIRTQFDTGPLASGDRSVSARN
jgi:hypothetical protein